MHVPVPDTKKFLEYNSIFVVVENKDSRVHT